MRIISGFLKRRILQTPKGEQTRPTGQKLRQTVFNIVMHHIEGAHVLDLCAGSGAMGIEAISCGAADACFVENEKMALKCLQNNISSLGIEKESSIFALDALKALALFEKQGKKFDLIYFDPPYHDKNLYEEVLNFLDRSSLCTADSLLLVESAKGDSLQEYSRLQKRESRTYGDSRLTIFTS